MLDLKYLRLNPEEARRCLKNKGSSANVDEVLALDEKRRDRLFQVEELKAQRNRVSEEISALKKAGNDAEALITEMRVAGDRVKAMDDEMREIERQLNELLLNLPNIHHHSAPVGEDETANVERKRWGEPRSFSFAPRPHWEIGESLGIMDFERAVKISGARFYVLKGTGSKLERALINFMIDLHVSEHGYTEFWPPVLVKSECMVGTGQLPKFGEDAFHCELDDLWLVPTAEVPITNLHRDEILEPGTLPLKYVAYTACFRREAGSAGKDTRGMTRVHQFDKVEMVKFVEPRNSYVELESLLKDAEDVIRALELPYRVVEICTGDLGFTASKKYDPEVWMPGQDRFMEVSSCSNFESFQARRAEIRYRPEKGAKPQYVHTLNGSGLAVGRTLAAVLENYQQADGSVAIPNALQPYMGGIGRITA